MLELIGKKALHAPPYAERDWQERDNFDTVEQARNYARTMSRMHYATPYRIRERRGRFVVEFVPSWRLQ